MFNTLSQVRKAFPTWFNKGSMRFFNTMIVSNLKTRGNRQFFITSEWFDTPTQAKFSLREVTEDGIDTVGEFCSMRSKADAIDLINEECGG